MLSWPPTTAYCSGVVMMSSGSSERRRYIRTVVPTPTSLSIFTWPPDCLTKPYTIDSPSPLPLPSGLVEKKGSKACSRTSGVMPQPLSLTAIITYWPAATSGGAPPQHSSNTALATSMRRWPVLFMASRALMHRLSTAFSTCTVSTRVFHRSAAMRVSTSISSPRLRRSMSSMPAMKRPMRTTRGSSAWRRPNASR